MSDYTNNIGIKISVRGATAGAKNIDKVTDALNRLNSASTGSKGFSNSVNSISSSLNSMANSSDAAGTSVSSTISKFSKLAAVVAIVKAATKVISNCVNESMEYTENLNLFTTIMGKYADEAMKYANTINQATGIDTSEWIYNEGVFMSLAKGFGIAGDEAALMSEQLTQLSYDIASFYNMDTETAMLKVKSGFSGELEPMRNIGYDLSQAKLKEIAKSLNISKSFTDMTQAEKAQLRYIAIMTQLTEVQGDMAKTITSPANQLRILQTSFTQLARSIGNMFIPMLQKVLPFLTQLAGAVKDVADELATFFGYSQTTFDNESDGVSALTDDLDDATESAKALKKQLASFDEISNLSTSTSSTSTSSTSFNIDFNKYTYDFLEKLSSSEMGKGLDKTREFLGDVKEAIKNIKDIVDECWNSIKPNLSNFMENGASIFKSIVELMPTIKAYFVKGTTNKIAESISKLGNALTSAWNWLVDVVKGLGESLIKPIIATKAVLDAAISGVITKIAGAISSIATVFRAITDFLHITTPESDEESKNETLSFSKPTKSKILAVNKLATGGIITDPTLAMVGEAGTEAVIPLENNTAWINALGQSINNSSSTDALLQTIISKIDGIDLQPTISVQDVGEASIHYINKKARLLGGSVV